MRRFWGRQKKGGQSRGSGGRRTERDGKRGIKSTREEATMAAVNEAVDGGAKRPAKDGVDGDAVTKGNADVDRGAIGKGIGKDIGDNGVEEAAKVGDGRSKGIGDSASKADGFEWFDGSSKDSKEWMQARLALAKSRWKE